MILILPLNGTIWTGLVEMMKEVTDTHLSGLTSIAVILAAMLAAFSIIKTTSSYIEGNDKFTWDIIRPIIILICVINFSDICYAFDSLVASISTKIVDSTDCTIKDFFNLFRTGFGTTSDNLVSSIKKIWDGEDNLIIKTISTIWTGVKNGLASLISAAEIGIVGVISGIGRILSELIFVVMEILAASYITLMRLFGPFILALSIAGFWKNNIPSLISRYIQISLWTPVGFICFAIINAATQQIVSMLTSLNLSGDHLGGIFYSLAAAIVSLSLIGSIPKICGWIVESAGAAGAHEGVMNAVKSVPTTAAKFMMRKK